MKRIITLIAVAALCGCGGKEAPYKNALPTDAAVVVAINPNQLEAKFNIKDFKATNIGKKMLDAADLAAEQKELITSLLQDPKQSGVSTSDKLYIFATADEHGGFVAGVEDRAKLSETLTKAGRTITEAGGRSFIETEQEGKLVAYDDNVLIGYTGNGTKAELQAVVEGLFAQKTGFLANNKEVTAALEGSADICSVVAYDKVMDLAKVMNPMVAMASRQMGGLEEMYKGLYASISANFEKGQIVVDIAPIYTDKEVQKKMDELAKKLTGTLKGDVLKYIPEDATLAFAANIKGAGIYEFMAEQESLKSSLAQVPVAKEILSAIEGDMAFAITNVKGQSTFLPDGAIFVELSKPDAITAYAAMAASLGAKAVEGRENQFIMVQGGMVLNFGVMDNLFYVTNDSRVVEALAGGKIASLAGNKLFKGVGAGFVNFAQLQGFLDGSDENVKQMTAAFDRLEVTQPDKNNSRFVLKMTDQSANAAEALFGIFDKMAGADSDHAEVVEAEAAA